ncbi:MAG: hypothetical protein QM698_16025 [Micropepsaceae bacterium]
MSREALAEALRSLGAFAPEDMTVPVRMTHRDGLLTLAALAAEADAPADGDWPPRVVMHLANLTAFAGMLPPGEIVTLTFDGSAVRIGPTRFSAESPGSFIAPAPLTVGMSQLDLLTAVAHHGRDRVVAAAGRSLVEQAESMLDEISEDAAALTAKLGIKAGDLRAALWLWLKQRAG